MLEARMTIKFLSDLVHEFTMKKTLQIYLIRSPDLSDPDPDIYFCPMDQNLHFYDPFCKKRPHQQQKTDAARFCKRSAKVGDFDPWDKLHFFQHHVFLRTIHWLSDHKL